MPLNLFHKKNGRFTLPNLHHPVTIQRDEQDIPHIHAKTRHDLFFAQGLVHAQERLWQMELNRRAAKGTLSELFGEKTLETDRLTRTLGFHQLAKQSWQRLEKQYQNDVLAYCEGINAYLAMRPPLPLELLLLWHRPNAWHPLDVIAYGRLQAWALTTGASGELIRAKLIKLLGNQKAASLLPTIPEETPITLPNGIDLNPFSAANLPPFMGKGQDASGRGSNGWVVSGKHTASGKPLLANDMHLPLRMPSLWFLISLQSDDGIHAAGFSQPGLPYILVGGNQHISWGATLAYTDCEDIVLEQFDPNDPTRYRTPNGYCPASTHTETIKIRNQPDHVEKIVSTHNGVVLPQPKQSKISMALASTALLPEAGFSGFAMLLTAVNWEQFHHAVTEIQSPPLNLLYADREGNIGHCLSGRIPIRAKGDGTLPVNGWETEQHWTGVVPVEQMPQTFNPVSGKIISANNRIVADDFPYSLGNVWRNGFRAQRIEKLLSYHRHHTAKDFMRYQLDDAPIPALTIMMATRRSPFLFTDPEANMARELLWKWNGRLSLASVGGAIYAVLLDQLSQLLLNPLLPPELRLNLLGRGDYPNLRPLNDLHGFWSVIVSRWLVGELDWLHEGREQTAVLEQAFSQTASFLKQRLGQHPESWQWGKLHTVTFPHVFDQQPPLGFFFNAGPYPASGDGDSIAQSSSSPAEPLVTSGIGVSSRHVSDLATGQLWALTSPGQSGRRFSHHRTDLIPLWQNGRLLPLFPQPSPTNVLVLLPKS